MKGWQSRIGGRLAHAARQGCGRGATEGRRRWADRRVRVCERVRASCAVDVERRGRTGTPDKLLGGRSLLCVYASQTRRCEQRWGRTRRHWRRSDGQRAGPRWGKLAPIHPRPRAQPAARARRAALLSSVPLLTADECARQTCMAPVAPPTSVGVRARGGTTPGAPGGRARAQCMSARDTNNLLNRRCSNVCVGARGASLAYNWNERSVDVDICCM